MAARPTTAADVAAEKQKVAAKISDEPASEEMEKRKNELVGMIAPSVFLTVFSGGMLWTARAAVAQKQFKSAAELTTFLSRLASAGAFFEFVANPIFGKFADHYGRRPVIPIGAAATGFLRLLLFLQPDKKWPLVLEQAVGIPLVTSFFSTFRATLGDSLQGAAFADANAKIGMAAGLSLVTGPLMTKLVMNRADPKYCYLVASILSLVNLVHMRRNYKETLTPEKRQPLNLADMQPFSFLKLMKHSVLSRLMMITGMQTFTEGRNITDFISIYLQDELKWSWDKINNFVSIYGVALIVSGITVKGMLKALGLRQFTTFSNITNSINLLCYARVPPLNLFLNPTALMYVGMLFGAFGGRKRDGAESLIMKIGNDAGFGNGFISGSMMNFRAIINVLGPLLFGSLYSWGLKRSYPQAIFLAGVATIMVAEASLQTLTDKELGLDARGQIIPKKKKEEEVKEAGDKLG